MRQIVLSLAFASLLLSSPGDAAELKSHPAFTPYAGGGATRRDDDGFKPYSLVTAVDGKGKTDEEVLHTLKVQGHVIRFAYENQKDRSAHEIYTNYRQGLEEGGFKILYACAADECGARYATSRWGRVTGSRHAARDERRRWQAPARLKPPPALAVEDEVLAGIASSRDVIERPPHI